MTGDETLWGGWALTRRAARLIRDRLAELQPEAVLECGSGSSTLLLAEHARRTGCRAVSLEHDPQHLERTLRLLDSHGLRGWSDVRLVPLAGDPPWYAPQPDGPWQFVLIDGPPGGVSRGRAAALPALWGRLAPGAEVWLDDAHRRGERRALERWRRDYGVAVETVDVGEGRAMARISRG